MAVRCPVCDDGTLEEEYITDFVTDEEVIWLVCDCGYEEPAI